MAIEWQVETEGLMVYRVSGVLSIDEMVGADKETQVLIDAGNSWKVLVLLDGFEGWSNEKGWGNTLLADRADEHVTRMAVAGPAEWRDRVEMFVLKGMRPVEIEYFYTEKDARDWLDA